jgi:hypothetical protein
VTVPFQSWVMVCPAPNDQVSRQPLMESPKFVTVTLALKPPGQELEMA